jgi:Fe-S-cluster containining protein
MNRHERRRERKLAQHNKFYSGYVAHLPRVPLDEPLERGRVYHLVFHHDSWCAFYDDKPCNCNPIITRHAEPRRS